MKKSFPKTDTQNLAQKRQINQIKIAFKINQQILKFKILCVCEITVIVTQCDYHNCPKFSSKFKN